MTEENTQFSLFLDCLNDGVLFFDHQGIVHFANIASLQMLGLSKQLIVGKGHS